MDEGSGRMFFLAVKVLKVLWRTEGIRWANCLVPDVSGKSKETVKGQFREVTCASGFSQL